MLIVSCLYRLILLLLHHGRKYRDHQTRLSSRKSSSPKSPPPSAPAKKSRPPPLHARPSPNTNYHRDSGHHVHYATDGDDHHAMLWASPQSTKACNPHDGHPTQGQVHLYTVLPECVMPNHITQVASSREASALACRGRCVVFPQTASARE